MRRAQVALGLLAVEHVAHAAHGRHPRTEDTVGEAAVAVLVLGTLFVEERSGLRGVLADHALRVLGATGTQAAPRHLLDEVLAVPELGLHQAPALLEELLVHAHPVAERSPHQYRRAQRAEVEARAHPVRAPELDVVGVVVRLFERPGVPRVPGLDAVVEARPDARPERAQPRGVARDAPLPVDLHDAAELPVGGGVEVVRGGPDRERGTERLVSARVLRDAELRLAQRPLQRREQVRQRLRVVPDVSARTVTAARVVSAALPGPEAAVRLTHDRRRLEDRQVGRDRLQDLGREGLVVEALREAGSPLAQLGVVRPPVLGRLLDARKARRVPGPVAALGHGLVVLGVLPDAQRARSHVPRELHHDQLRGTRREVERHEHAGTGRGTALGDGRSVVAGTLLDVAPGEGQVVEPAAAEPGVIDPGNGVARPHAERSLLPRLLLGSAGPEDEAAGDGAHRRLGLFDSHEVAGVPREDTAQEPGAGVRQPVLESRERQARAVGIARLERAPARQLDLQRNLVVLERHRPERETGQEARATEPGQAPGGAAAAVAGVLEPEPLPARDGSLEDSGQVGLALEAHRRKHAGLLEDVGLVAERHVRERPRSLEAQHPRAHPPEGERDAAQGLALVGAVVRAP